MPKLEKGAWGDIAVDVPPTGTTSRLSKRKSMVFLLQVRFVSLVFVCLNKIFHNFKGLLVLAVPGKPLRELQEQFL